MPYADIHFGATSLPLARLAFTVPGIIFGTTATVYAIRHREFPLFFGLMLFLSASMFASSFLTDYNRAQALSTSVGFLLRGFAPAALIYFLVKYGGVEQRLKLFLVFLGAAVAFGALYEVVTHHFFLLPREMVHYDPAELWLPKYGFAVGAIGQPLPLSILLSLFFPFVLFSWGKVPRWVYIKVNVLVAACVFMTFRRSAYILFFLTILLRVLSLKEHRRTVFVWMSVFVFVAAMFVFSFRFSREMLLSRFSVRTTIHEIQNKHRGKVYGMVGEMFKGHPIFGWGTRQFPVIYKAYASYRGAINTPDSQYLRFLVEGGVVGLVSFLLLMGYGLWGTFVNRVGEGWPFFAAMVNFALALLIIDGLYWPAIQMVALVIMGAGVARSQRDS
jgi:O-antigen ligase